MVSYYRGYMYYHGRVSNYRIVLYGYGTMTPVQIDLVDCFHVAVRLTDWTFIISACLITLVADELVLDMRNYT